MSEPLYVSTDHDGLEHAATGLVTWRLPENGAAPPTVDQPLLLRSPVALLEVLDEVIYQAEALADVTTDPDGTVHTSSARLIAKTRWNTESATRFALACAEHILGDKKDVTLPDGTSVGKVISDAQQLLDQGAATAEEHFGYLARVAALHRLKRERSELGDIALGLALEDEAKDVEALEDPAYATVAPVIDAVLAAIEALRHHTIPRLEEDHQSKVEEREQHEGLDGKFELRTPSVVVTPFGPGTVGGGPRLVSYEPAWTSAREAARHSRMAALDQLGKPGEAAERSWQAATLAALLAP